MLGDKTDELGSAMTHPGLQIRQSFDTSRLADKKDKLGRAVIHPGLRIRQTSRAEL